MKIGKGLRDVAGIILSASMMLALGVAGAGTANADDANVTTTVSDGEIEITGAPADHTFAAVKIASYDMATATDDTANGKITGISLTTVDASTVAAAVTAANGGTAPTGDYDASNPMNWVANNWMNSSGAPYAGTLRTFVEKLTPNLTFGAGTALDASNKLTNLAEGVYVIKDTTALAANAKDTNSIPMLVGTTVGPNKLTDFNASTAKVGQIAMKAVSPTLTKEVKTLNTTEVTSDADWKNAAIGSNFGFEITTHVPMTTNFDHFTFNVVDTPSSGFEYQASPAPVVTIGGVEQNVGTDYSIDTTGDKLTFKFLTIRDKDYNAEIKIDYTMKLTKSGSQNNSAVIDYSNDSGNQPTSDGGTDGSHGTTDPVSISLASYTIKLKNELKADGSALAGATFSVEDTKFSNHSQSNDYDVDPDGTETLTADTDGTLTMYGFKTGTYKFTQLTSGKKGGTAIPQVVRPTFTVKIENSTTAGQTKFTLTPDVWGLVGFSASPTGIKTETTQDTTSTEADITVQSVTSVAQLPLTGGAGVILLAALIVISGSVAAGTAVLRRRNAMAR
ncbi:SpaA isopeptide-forming pilin-related protein [Bifidobacterium sp. ESL0763]|uniref:SpaA isopeptide-forming pilin-related protein n=1 Tax=Bifidobacterium sp. ESL0763 TaxID=2983227 RepID=UPI0023F8B234|nr:SpaA isopeptide-forming pilin-related protein [Bifidobacterium sp. ESL0763]MDF7663154.1 SpaA isopeptide-forming pilin-related protein [Bifidobacterium sp. ESL0763]